MRLVQIRQGYEVSESRSPSSLRSVSTGYGESGAGRQ